MKAFVIDRYKPADGGHLADVNDPVAAAGQVLVQVHAAGVNQLDAKIRNGDFKMILRYAMPLVLGSDVAGDGTDLISELRRAEFDGQPIPDDVILGMIALVLIAGLDTTWSASGSMLLHLASHPDDTRRLVAEPELLPNAIEEMLRAFSPVTMARIAVDDVELHDCLVHEGDRVLLNVAAANRDPEMFLDADQVIVDRQLNRHVAFGAGIQRCAGSNLARMMLRVGLEEWLARIPTFHLDPDRAVTWAGGQIRGPRAVPVLFP